MRSVYLYQTETASYPYVSLVVIRARDQSLALAKKWEAPEEETETSLASTSIKRPMCKKKKTRPI